MWTKLGAAAAAILSGAGLVALIWSVGGWKSAREYFEVDAVATHSELEETDEEIAGDVDEFKTAIAEAERRRADREDRESERLQERLETYDKFNREQLYIQREIREQREADQVEDAKAAQRFDQALQEGRKDRGLLRRSIQKQERLIETLGVEAEPEDH